MPRRHHVLDKPVEDALDFEQERRGVPLRRVDVAREPLLRRLVASRATQGVKGVQARDFRRRLQSFVRAIEDGHELRVALTSTQRSQPDVVSERLGRRTFIVFMAISVNSFTFDAVGAYILRPLPSLTRPSTSPLSTLLPLLHHACDAR